METVIYYVFVAILAAFIVVCIDYYRIHCMLMELYERVDSLEDIYNDLVSHLNLMEISNGKLLPLLEKFEPMLGIGTIKKGEKDKGNGEA